MSELSDIVNNIFPDLKTGVGLITLSIGFLKAGHWCWTYEKEDSKESIDRLKEVLGHFKDVYIRPILERQTQEWIDGAYEEAVKKSHLHAMSFFDGKPKGSSITDSELNVIFSKFNQSKLIEELKSNDKISEFYSSQSGVGLLDKLDLSFLKARDFKRYYDLKIDSCRMAMYLFFTLALMLFISIAHLIFPFPEALVYFVLYSAIITFIIGIVNVLRFEYYRRKLSTTWQELKMIGNIDA